jgi:hypothetical protein
MFVSIYIRIEDVMGDIEETNFKSISIANVLGRGIRAKNE